MEGYVPTDNLQFAVSKMVNQQPFFDFRPCRELLLAAFQLYFGIWQINENYGHTMFNKILRLSNLGP